MKKILVLLLSGIFFGAHAQDNSGIKAGWGTLDFAVPDAPALQVLGVTSDNIIKPTSVRAATIGIGNYLLTNGSVIPKDLAVELSPLLIDQKVNLYRYNQNKFLYRARLSLGTSVNQNGSFAISEGIRLTLIDKSDLRSQMWFVRRLASYAQDEAVNINKATAEFMKQKEYADLLQQLNITNVVELKTKADEDTMLMNRLLEFESKFLSNNNIQPLDVEALRDSVRSELWNAPIWEVGGAALQSSPDSLLGNVGQTQRVTIWSTAGYPLGKNGQALGGLNFGQARDDSGKWQTVFSLGVRIYYGKNQVRGYFQGQYDYQNKQNEAVADLGCEFLITSGLWADVAADLKSDSEGNVSFFPKLSVRFGSPEKKRL